MMFFILLKYLSRISMHLKIHLLNIEVRDLTNLNQRLNLSEVGKDRTIYHSHRVIKLFCKFLKYCSNGKVMPLLFITSVHCEECIFVFGCLHCRNGELGNYSFQLGFANLMIVRRGERDTLHSIFLDILTLHTNLL